MKTNVLAQMAVFSLLISCGMHNDSNSRPKVPKSTIKESLNVNNSQRFFNGEVEDIGQNNSVNEELEILDTTTLNILSKYNFLENIEDLEPEDTEAQGEQNKIDLTAIIDSIELESIELVESGDDASDISPGDLFSTNENTLCQTFASANGALSFDCQPIDLNKLINAKRPCFYEDKLYLHGSIIPVNPGVYRLTPSGSVVTIQPGIFLVCKDGSLVPQSLPENRIY